MSTGTGRSSTNVRTARGARRRTVMLAVAAPAASLMVLGLAAGGTTAASASPVAPPGAASAKTATWVPTMNSQFHRINPNRWTVLNNVGHANENSWLEAANVTTAHGILRVQGKKQPAGGRAYGSAAYCHGGPCPEACTSRATSDQHSGVAL